MTTPPKPPGGGPWGPSEPGQTISRGQWIPDAVNRVRDALGRVWVRHPDPKYLNGFTRGTTGPFAAVCYASKLTDHVGDVTVLPPRAPAPLWAGPTPVGALWRCRVPRCRAGGRILTDAEADPAHAARGPLAAAADAARSHYAHAHAIEGSPAARWVDISATRGFGKLVGYSWHCLACSLTAHGYLLRGAALRTGTLHVMSVHPDLARPVPARLRGNA